ncbi:hypothetical protein LXA43DRAFT_1149417 [Ganoderma leucocontextum]|nr:hypothetical protein LXA43DRAFT_1149417 [Ganoderma leucocontextum]
MYRFKVSFLYNFSLVSDAIMDYVKENTKRGQDMMGVKSGDRPWNDPGKNPDLEAEENTANRSYMQSCFPFRWHPVPLNLPCTYEDNAGLPVYKYHRVQDDYGD